MCIYYMCMCVCVYTYMYIYIYIYIHIIHTFMSVDGGSRTSACGAIDPAYDVYTVCNTI